MKPENLVVGARYRVRGNSKTGHSLQGAILYFSRMNDEWAVCGVEPGRLDFDVHPCQLVPIVKKPRREFWVELNKNGLIIATGREKFTPRCGELIKVREVREKK